MSFTAVVRRAAGVLIVIGLLGGCASAPVDHRADYGYRDYGVRYYDAAPVYVQPVTRLTIQERIVLRAPTVVHRVAAPRPRPSNVDVHVRVPQARGGAWPDRPHAERGRHDGRASARASGHGEGVAPVGDAVRRGGGITPDGRARSAHAVRAAGSVPEARASDGRREWPADAGRGGRSDTGRGAR